MNNMEASLPNSLLLNDEEAFVAEEGKLSGEAEAKADAVGCCCLEGIEGMRSYRDLLGRETRVVQLRSVRKASRAKYQFRVRPMRRNRPLAAQVTIGGIDDRELSCATR